MTKALIKACQNRNVSMDIISKMLEMGGRQLLYRDNTFFYAERSSQWHYNYNYTTMLFRGKVSWSILMETLELVDSSMMMM